MLLVLVVILTFFKVDTVFTGDAAAHPSSHAVVLLFKLFDVCLKCSNFLLLLKNILCCAKKIDNF